MSIVKVSWSGGKDSTCALSLHLEQCDIVKALCYVPMFNDTIPLITKRHYDFLLNKADFFRSQGAEVHFVHGISYSDFVTRKITRGKSKGLIFGFPCFVTGCCTFKNYSKIKALNSFDVGYYDYQSIGIAFDELHRHSQLTDKKRSILFEKRFTEYDAFRFCSDNDLLSPLYEFSFRDGCALCPQAKEIVRSVWYNDYPQAKSLLVELQDFVKRERPNHYPLRNYQWFIDTSTIQYSFFD